VFVTHDQEEAMEVADRVVVMNHGRVEQVAGPRELYDRPANDFVMTFVGEAIEFDGQLVRPHELEITFDAEPDTREAQVERIVHLGFDARCELTLDDGTRITVQMTRQRAAELELEPGQIVLVRRPGVRVGGELSDVVR
jgi:sulfate/thiosulfate transport system ATP-binding protein